MGRITAMTSDGVALEPENWWVEARANVLGLRYGERAYLPTDTFELAECLSMGLVVRVAEDGTVPDPLPRTVHGGCGGCGGR
jgi:hypothetical protein